VVHEAIRAGVVASCHDISEGGLAVALAEMCIASQLGASIDALPHADLATALFSESAGRLLVEIAPDDLPAFMAIAGSALEIGTVTSRPVLDVVGVFGLDVAELAAAFTRNGW
jgi:phosphoribosylformylglycinamidine synthase